MNKPHHIYFACLGILMHPAIALAQIGVEIESIYLPHFVTREDKDDYLPEHISLDADLDQGSGRGFRVGFVGDEDDIEERTPLLISLGMLYMMNSHNIKNTVAEVGVHSLYIEPMFKYYFNQGHPRVYIEGSIGAGGMLFDFANPRGNRIGTALEIRFGAAVDFTRYLGLHLGVGQFIWGFPSETIARGGFTTIGLGFKF